MFHIKQNQKIFGVVDAAREQNSYFDVELLILNIVKTLEASNVVLELNITQQKLNI